MADVFNGLKPENIWKHFQEILKIPHCSGNEHAFGEYIIEFAKENDLEWEKDETGNVVIRKSASPGKEDVEGIILQGHMDMVCEKNSDVTHDFKNDPIQPELKDGWIKATGTTLGADNAIGIAASLAIMEDKSLIHGPLECLFTVEEETGLRGAMDIKPDFLKGKRLLNLDSEDEGEFTIGCAGGADSTFFLPLKREESPAPASLCLKISGFKGGHSGVDINLGRANAIKSLARILWQIQKSIPFRLIEIEGGNLRNAIPREAWANISADSENINSLKEAAEKAFDAIKNEYKAIEPESAFSITEGSESKSALNPESHRALVNFLFSLPHGVIAMHAEMKDLVETSNNLAVVHTHADKAEIICSTRSSTASALQAVRDSMAALAELIDSEIIQEEGYPGWTPNLTSPLLKTLNSVYKKTFGVEPHVAAIHAGLECGLIGEKFPGMDMISFGPTIKFPHSPDEKVDVASVEKFWKFLVICLEELT